jgi:hypothetical protein
MEGDSVDEVLALVAQVGFKLADAGGQTTLGIGFNLEGGGRLVTLGREAVDGGLALGGEGFKAGAAFGEAADLRGFSAGRGEFGGELGGALGELGLLAFGSGALGSGCELAQKVAEDDSGDGGQNGDESLHEDSLPCSPNIRFLRCAILDEIFPGVP